MLPIHLISAIFLAISYRENKIPGTDSETIKFVLFAFTGKGAFNIGGEILHSFLSLPVNQNNNLTPLAAGTLNTLHRKLMHLKLIIIDEISGAECLQM